MPQIPLPVKPFVAKYIFARYQTEVWEINRQERIGKVIYAMLERYPLRKEKELDLGAEVTLAISREYYRNKGIYLSNASVLSFNDFIQAELIEEIAMYIYQVKNRIGLKKYRELYIRHQLSKGERGQRVIVVKDPNVAQYFEQKEIIYDTLRLYHITEDDLPFDTVQKAVQRLKLPLLMAS
ncbi:MAG TPA: hypothetical protein VHA56_16190 [Mucilaginibacter sp.]|nr:hypothetical protein [Mucilaginibacter sp.]